MSILLEREVNRTVGPSLSETGVPLDVARWPAISVSSVTYGATDSTVVAAAAGQTNYVTNIVLWTGATAGVVTFYDGPSATGPEVLKVYMPANTTQVIPLNPWIKLTAGKALVAKGAASMSGDAFALFFRTKP